MFPADAVHHDSLHRPAPVAQRSAIPAPGTLKSSIMHHKRLPGFAIITREIFKAQEAGTFVKDILSLPKMNITMADTWKIHDKTFTKYMPDRKIQAGVRKLAARLNKEYEGKKPLFVAVLNGSFIFASDLLKRITIDCEIAFVKVSSYRGVNSTGKIHELIGLEIPVEGRHVILVEDIVDTGLTIIKVIEKIKSMNAAEVKVAACLMKPDAYKKDYPIDYVCFRIPNDFVVGYGLDYDGLGRNSADIYRIEE